MSWLDKTDKLHSVRTDTGVLVAKITGNALNSMLSFANASDLKIQNEKYVFLNDDGFKLSNNGITVFLWKGFTIDCIPK